METAKIWSADGGLEERDWLTCYIEMSKTRLVDEKEHWIRERLTCYMERAISRSADRAAGKGANSHSRWTQDKINR